LSSQHQHHSSVSALRAITLYVILTSIFGAWLFWDAAFLRLVIYAPWGDYWEHTALLTEWMGHFWDPGNPHVDDASLSPRYMPMFWVLTLAGLLFGLDSIQLMSIAAAVNYLLIVVGLHVFLKNYFRDPWAPLIGYLAIFFCWGVSWNWSNLYHLRSFFYVASFPSTFAFGLSLLAFALTLRILRRARQQYVLSALLCVLAALMFLCHPLTGVFGISGCALLAITETSEKFSLRLLTLVSLAAACLLAELWPFFSVWKVSLGLYGSGAEQWFASSESMGALERLRSGVWKHIFYDPRMVLTILGPALLGLPLCFMMLFRRENLFVVFGAFCMAVPYLLHPFIEVPLAHRFLLFVVTYFHFAIVWGVLQIIDAWTTRPRSTYAAFLMLGLVAVTGTLLATNIALISIEFEGNTLDPDTLRIKDKRAVLPAGMSVVEVYETLTDPLPEEAVVLTTPSVGWPLPTFKGKVISLYHENPMLLDQEERYAATTAFFAAPQKAGVRTALIEKYGATHLLLSGEPKNTDLVNWLLAHTKLVAGVGRFRMYELVPFATAARPPAMSEIQAEEVAVKPRVEVEVEVEQLAVPVVPLIEAAPASPPTTVSTPLELAPEPATISTHLELAPEPVIMEAAKKVSPSKSLDLAKQKENEARFYGVPVSELSTSPEDSGVSESAETSGTSSPVVYGAPIPEPVLEPEESAD
jgi:hypothetical protein